MQIRLLRVNKRRPMAEKAHSQSREYQKLNTNVLQVDTNVLQTDTKNKDKVYIYSLKFIYMYRGKPSFPHTTLQKNEIILLSLSR